MPGCRSCGTLNPAHYRFCGECGTSLGQGSPPVTTDGAASATRPAMLRRAVLQRLREDGALEEHPVESRLGIGTEADLAFPEDRFLSRRHAVVEREGEQFVLRDLESTNGTFLRVATEYELKPGDVVMVGGQIFEFRL